MKIRGSSSSKERARAIERAGTERRAQGGHGCEGKGRRTRSALSTKIDRMQSRSEQNGVVLEYVCRNEPEPVRDPWHFCRVEQTVLQRFSKPGGLLRSAVPTDGTCLPRSIKQKACIHRVPGLADPWSSPRHHRQHNQQQPGQNWLVQTRQP